jgi:hypothetical protein
VGEFRKDEDRGEMIRRMMREGREEREKRWEDRRVLHREFVKVKKDRTYTGMRENLLIGEKKDGNKQWK